jgi:uncharacterized protein YndB with AHSA1/START domain
MNRELSVHRHIEAPVTHVWETMMDRFEEWFCPRPWRAEARQIEWRPGGRSLVVMHGPDGEEMLNEGVILDVAPGRRFVFSDAFTGDWQPSGPFMVGLFEIASDGTGTRFTATARHWTDEAAEQHRIMGFDAGWGAMADQLKTLAEGGTL